jgi:hypothetical protein
LFLVFLVDSSLLWCQRTENIVALLMENPSAAAAAENPSAEPLRDEAIPAKREGSFSMDAQAAGKMMTKAIGLFFFFSFLFFPFSFFQLDCFLLSCLFSFYWLFVFCVHFFQKKRKPRNQREIQEKNRNFVCQSDLTSLQENIFKSKE